MLEKFIIHLKNLFFFKLVVSSFIIGSLLYFKPKLNNELLHVQKIARETSINLSNTSSSLQTALALGDEIITLNDQYQELSNTFQENECLTQKLLGNKLLQLTNIYNLLNPIEISVFQQNLDIANNLNKNNIKYFDVKLKFQIADFNILENIIDSIMQLMPQGSILISIEAATKETLDSVIVSKLSPNIKPDLIYCNLNIQVRELYFNK